MISIIIPVYNEEQVLNTTLQQLANHQTYYEVIIVDGGSTDRTCEIARELPGVTLLHANKGRAAQMNVGAKVARGDWLLFLHADTLLPANALFDIQNLPTNIKAGAFRHRFSGNDWKLRIISHLDNFRCQRNRIMYGDQAMFIRHALFEKMGGFPELAILEDLYFCVELKNHTQAVLMDNYVVTDSRKFTKMGIWRSFYHLVVILTRVQFGLSVEKNYPFFKDVR